MAHTHSLLNDVTQIDGTKITSVDVGVLDKTSRERSNNLGELGFQTAVASKDCRYADLRPFEPGADVPVMSVIKAMGP